MGKILFDEQPLVVNRVLAKLIGLNEAIVLQQIHYWLQNNKSKKSNFIDGRFWTYNSIQKWHEDEFNFWSYDTVKRAFAKLEDKKILISGNYNTEKRDKTKWYSIDYDLLELLVSGEEEKSDNTENNNSENDSNENDGGLHQCIRAKCPNALGQNAPVHWGKMPQPLPKTSTKTTNRDIHNNPKKKTAYAEFVKLFDEEYKKLVEKFGEQKTIAMIEMLDNYKGARGATYKSDYRAILNWVVDAYNKRIPTQQRGQTPSGANVGAYAILE